MEPLSGEHIKDLRMCGELMGAYLRQIRDLEAERDALKAAIQAKCAYCRESWDAGLDDPAFCPTNCPLLPYRGGE